MITYRALDRETVSSLVAATGLTTTKLTNGVDYATIQAVGGSVRFCLNGTTPTSSLGQVIPDTRVIEVWGYEALKNFLAINNGGIAKLEVIYFGGI